MGNFKVYMFQSLACIFGHLSSILFSSFFQNKTITLYYTVQVPRILKPIAQCIDRLPQLVHDTAFHAYVSAEWGSINGLRLQVLSDFFKHGFDGSGDDGGSCIDGRLTSAWNWCRCVMNTHLRTHTKYVHTHSWGWCRCIMNTQLPTHTIYVHTHSWNWCRCAMNTHLRTNTIYVHSHSWGWCMCVIRTTLSRLRLFPEISP